VITALPRQGQSKSYRAANYDVLVDSPVHAGKVDLIPFAVGKTKFRVAMAGIGNYSEKQLIADSDEDRPGDLRGVRRRARRGALRRLHVHLPPAARAIARGSST
jgi:hypothetical protein